MVEEKLYITWEEVNELVFKLYKELEENGILLPVRNYSIKYILNF